MMGCKGSRRGRIVLLCCGIAALTACGATATPTAAPATGTVAPAQGTTATTAAPTTARLRVFPYGVPGSNCGYQLAGDGLRPGTQIAEESGAGRRIIGLAAPDFTSIFITADDDRAGTITAQASDGSTVQTAYRITCAGKPTAALPAGVPAPAPTAVGVSASGAGRLEVKVVSTFEAACIYRISGTGLQPGARIMYDGQRGTQQYGPVAADGSYRSGEMTTLAKDGDYGTLTAQASDGSVVTVVYHIGCNPPGEGFA